MFDCNRYVVDSLKCQPERPLSGWRLLAWIRPHLQRNIEVGYILPPNGGNGEPESPFPNDDPRAPLLPSDSPSPVPGHPTLPPPELLWPEDGAPGNVMLPPAVPVLRPSLYVSDSVLFAELISAWAESGRPRCGSDMQGRFAASVRLRFLLPITVGSAFATDAAVRVRSASTSTSY